MCATHFLIMLYLSVKFHQISLSREFKLESLDFEMLILLHALHCVDSCISVFDLK